MPQPPVNHLAIDHAESLGAFLLSALFLPLLGGGLALWAVFTVG